MASKEEIQKKFIDEINVSLGDQINLVSQIQDEMTQVLKVFREKGTLDKASLDNIKAVVKETRALKSEYNSVKEVQQDISKNQKLQNELERQKNALIAQGGESLKEELNNLQSKENSVKRAEEILKKYTLQQMQGVIGADKLVERAKANLAVQQNSLNIANQLLTPEAQQFQLLEKAVVANQKNNQLLAEQLKKVKNLEEAERGLVKGFENLGKILDKMGMGKTAKVFTDTAAKAKKMLYEASEGGTKSVGIFTKMKIGAMAFGSALKVALGPMAIIGMLITGFQKWKEKVKAARDLMAQISQETMDFGRNLGMSSSMATKVAGNAKAIGGAMGMTREQSVGAAQAIYGQINGVEKLSNSTMKTFMKLNVHGGISAETIGRMYQMSKLTGAEAGTVAKNIANQAQHLIKNMKLNVSMKSIMEGVSKVSNRMLLSSGGYSKSLTLAVATAKKLGLEMDQVENIANSLLNIEDSIAAEMEAELLTGKELNLEKAREAALNGDNTKLMEALAEQGITAADYGKMNRVQQEALGKALGMNGEELGKMLVTQEQNKASNQELLDTQKQGIDAMTTMASLAETLKNMEEAKTLAAAGGAGEMTKFEAAMVKLQEATAPLIDMLFIPMLDTLTLIVDQVTKIITAFTSAKNEGKGFGDSIAWAWQQADGLGKVMMAIVGTIGLIRAGQIAVNIATKAYKIGVMAVNTVMGIGNTIMGIKKGIQAGILVAQGKEEAAVARLMFKQTASLTKSVGIAIMKVISSLAAIPVAGWALGIAAAGAIGVMAAKYMNDGVQGPVAGGKAGYSRTMYGPEGAISFNDKDTIVAGTNLGGGQSGGNDSAMLGELQRVSSLLQQILSKEGAVMIDGNKVGVTLALSNYQSQ